MPNFEITVIVEQYYRKVIKAPSLAAAERKADFESIAGDEKYYEGSEAMDAIVEPTEDEE